MNNKIEGLTPAVARPATAAAAKSPASGSAASSARAPADDSVSLSEAAVDIAALSQQLKSAPAIDSARVAEVRDAIDSGTYRIDDQAIARGIIRAERDLNE